ncbi:MAG: hypothetical protein Q9M40_03830 [Sulfurimonas sp.]|nr:hypothetical protein [Sulfurimonas sp.]
MQDIMHLQMLLQRVLLKVAITSAPAQGQGQSYQQPQQQQSYQKPAQQQSYNNNQTAQQQSRQMPSPDTVPSYDINEDEIPF